MKFRILVFIFFFPIYLEAFALSPIGMFDSISQDSGMLNGWAKDPDSSSPVSIHVYRDGMYLEYGSIYSVFTADKVKAGIGPYGFDYTITSPLRDGRSHSIYVYAIDNTGDANILIQGSPKLMVGEKTEVWLNWTSPIWGLATLPDAEFLKKNIDVILFYSKPWASGYDFDTTVPVGDVENFISLARNNGIKVAIEVAGLYPHYAVYPSCVDSTLAGYKSFEIDWALIDRFYKMGGVVDYVSFDGSLNNLLWPYEQPSACFSVKQAAKQLVEAMKRWREYYPSIKFTYISNFPALKWKGQSAYHYARNSSIPGPDPAFNFDFYEILQEITSAANDEGLAFDGINVDNPYDYALGEAPSNIPGFDASSIDWIGRIRNVEHEVKNNIVNPGMKFGLIFNSERAGDEVAGSNALFRQEALDYVDAYHARGGAPDRYIIQSWLHYPDSLLPEDNPNSMAGLANQVIRKIRVREVQNGGFESPKVSGMVGGYKYVPLASGWIFVGAAGIAANQSDFTYLNPDAPEGVQVAFLQGASGFFRKTINTYLDGYYSIGFSAAQRMTYSLNNQQIEVIVDGASVGTFVPTSTSYEPFVTPRFHLSSGPHVIRFSGNNPIGDNTAFIDYIYVIPK